MDTILSKCVILKNLPATLGEEDVRQCLDSNGFGGLYHDIEQYAVNDADVRWIVFFKTTEDAQKCLHIKEWAYSHEDETVIVTPVLCSECLIPDKWFQQTEKSLEGDTASGAEGWDYVSQESYMSIESEDLFGSLRKHCDVDLSEYSEENGSTSYDNDTFDKDDESKQTMGMNMCLDNVDETDQQETLNATLSSEYDGSGATNITQPNTLGETHTQPTAQTSDTLDENSEFTGDKSEMTSNTNLVTVSDNAKPEITTTNVSVTQTQSEVTTQSVPKVKDMQSSAPEQAQQYTGQLMTPMLSFPNPNVHATLEGIPPVSMAASPLSPTTQGSDTRDQCSVIEGDKSEIESNTDSMYLTVSEGAKTDIKETAVSGTQTKFNVPLQSVPEVKDMQSSTSDLLQHPPGYPMAHMFPFPYPNVHATALGFPPVCCPSFVQPYFPGYPPGFPSVYPAFYTPYPQYPNWPTHIPPGQGPFLGHVSRPEFHSKNTDSMNSQYQAFEGSTCENSSRGDAVKMNLKPNLPPKQRKLTTEEETHSYTEPNDVECDTKMHREDDPEEHIYDSVDSLNMLDSFSLRKQSTQKPDVPPKESRLRVYVVDEKIEAVNCPKVTVTGFQADMANEEMELFFESKIRSGGGDISTFELSKSKKAVAIEFKNCSDAEDVLKKANTEGGILYKGMWLKVSRYIEPTMDPVRVFVSGMSDKTSDAIATLFIEAKWHIIPKNIVRGEMPGTALIEFNKQPDVPKLKAICEEHACAEAFWNVNHVELSSKVLVKECNPRTTAEALELYFENSKRSGGGDILCVEPHHDLSNAFVVSFKSVSDAERVCKLDRTHVLDNCNITVSLYFPCLDRDPSEEVVIPEPVLIDDLNQYRARFLFESAQHKARMEVCLKDVFGRPVWSVDNNSCKILKIECTVDPKDPSSRRFIDNWEAKCRESITWIFNDIKVDETNLVAAEIFEQVKIKLQDVRVARPEALAICLDRKSSGIVIVGEANEVDQLSKNIAKLIADLENELAKNNETATKTFKLKHYEYFLLKASDIDRRLQTEGLQISIDGENKQITLSGRFQTVTNAVSIVQDILTSFVRKEVPGYTKLSVDLMFKNQTKHLIKKAFFQNKLIGVWDFEKRTRLYMYSSNDADLQKCVQVLRETLTEKHRAFSEDDISVLRSSKGAEFLHDLEKKHEGLVNFAFEGNELRIASVVGVYEEILKDLDSFITSNSVAYEIIEVERGKFTFIYTYKKTELKLIEQQYQVLKVVGTTIDEKMKKGFMFEGPRSAVKATITKIQQLIDNIVLKDVVITTPGYDEFIERKSGNRALREIEDRRQCVIRYVTNKADKEELDMCDDFTSGETFSVGACKLTFLVRDITQIQADALINPCSIGLSNIFGLGALLIKKGGPQIQQELDTFKKGNVMIGGVYVTKAGNLPYKAILHIVVPSWSGKALDENRLLGSAVYNALECAEKCGFKKIVSPPVGTGIPGFPTDTVAAIMIKTIGNFFQSGTNRVIQNVLLCDIKEDTIDALLTAYKEGGQVRLRPRAQGQLPTSSSVVSKVAVQIGTLANTQADVLVNSTNKDLDLHVGTVSRQLLAAAGETLSQECKARYPTGISFGEVAVTSAGQMQNCKLIFHGLLPGWDHGQGQSEKMLFHFVISCLNKATELKARSIAFPALGTGALSYPGDQVANIMFEAVERFFKDAANSSLEKVFFVIWSGDTDTVSAFQQVENDSKQYSTEKIKSKPSRYIPSVVEKYAVDEGEFTTTIGNITLKIVQEDLVKQTTGAIVNSTLEELDLSKGLVSKAILETAGEVIQRECLSPANTQRIRKEGLVVTGPGKLLCQKIIHLRARSNANGWNETLLKCLQEVDNLGLNSVAFPALGTGGKGLSPDTMARTMYQSVRQYAANTKGAGSLKSVRIVLFNADLVDQFTATIRSISDPTRQSKRFLLPWKKRPDKSNAVTVFIYANSEHIARQAAADVGIVYDSYKIGLSKTCVKCISESQIPALERKAKMFDVKIDVQSDGIVIQGLTSKVAEMAIEVDACIQNIEHATTTKKSIPLPPSWNMTLDEKPKVVSLNPSGTDFNMLAQKFCNETGVLRGNIVSIERIQNPTLYMQYYGKKKEMEAANSGSKNPVERKLWHGTRQLQAADNINQKGFDRNFSSGASLGSGVYFAVNARTSLGYCQPDDTGLRRMYCADVLTGDFCVGSLNIKKPPFRNDPKNPMWCFDSTTDNMAAPGVFVIFHDAQAYPSFLITFR